VLAAWPEALVCLVLYTAMTYPDLNISDPNFFAGMTCVNVRMFEGVDLKALKIKFADGKNYTPGE
jgi:hypothetical protein